MARFEVTTLVLAPPETVFDASLSVDLHTSSMRGAHERAVAGVTSGHLSLGAIAELLVPRRYMTRLIVLRNAYIRQVTEAAT
ncbi:hypothetical protein [Nonomuraea sp. NPDC050643]|uniref:hypothetical protein n=1 Tax=Nonomuraea sp. NPDC050643 TaxID=3155660 RepID=UPI0033F07F1E